MFLNLAIFTVCAGVAFGEVHLKELNQRTSEQFARQVLDAHNRCRARHGVSPLVLNETMMAFSQNWAEYLSGQPELSHSDNQDYGENIYWSWSSSPDYDVTGDAPVDDWYSEINSYVFNQEPTNDDAGHFTQVMWKNSKQIGVGKERKDGQVWVVVDYYPSGNWPGEYVDNVPARTNP